MSKYVLNKTKLRTANNYRINDIELDLDINKAYDLDGFNINSDIDITNDIKDNLSTKIGLNFDKYYELNINIGDNKIIDKTIIIEKNINGMFINQININIGSNSKVDFIIKYTSDEDSINFLKQNLNIKENSNCNITILNLINKTSKSFIEIENIINDNSFVKYNFIDLGGNLKISNYNSNLIGIDSNNEFNNIYIGNDNDRIDLNYNIDNNNIKTNSNMNIQGVLTDNSYKSCKFIIDFKEGSTKSIGSENENCILLSDNCKSTSLPMLLCHEEDVNGVHSVSTGKIDENKLFYLMSKGISKKEAVKLIIYANFNKIIENINDIDIQNEIINIIDKMIK